MLPVVAAPTCLVIGAGGTGKSHRLRELINERAQRLDLNADEVPVLSGHPARSPRLDRLESLLAGDVSLLAVDDLQWFDDDVLDALADASERIAIVATRRPWPVRPSIRLLDDLIGRSGGSDTTIRLGAADESQLGAVASSITGGAMSTSVVTDLHEITAGSIGLLADALSAGWMLGAEALETSDLPPPLVDAVVARAERAGPEAFQLCSLLALQPDLDIALASDALSDDIDPDVAERSIRAGGLLDESERIVPLVGRSLRNHLTSRERAVLHDRLATVVSASMPDAGIDHLLAGTGRDAIAVDVLIAAVRRTRTSDPDRTLHLVRQASEVGIERPELRLAEAEAGFWLGLPDSLDLRRSIDGLGPNDRASHALLGFGSDVRDLRWSAAASRRVSGSMGSALREFAHACLGVFPAEAVEESDDQQSAEERIIRQMTLGLHRVATGEAASGLALLAQAADDVDRMAWSLSLGVTPHFLAAAAAMGQGDGTAAEALLDQAIETQAGGPGEQRSHDLLRATVRLNAADFAPALALVREGDEPTWPQRDRLLLAALDAALARRSGDTTRLREAWARTETVLVRPSASWLLVDQVAELLTAGARLGDERRVRPVETALVEQLTQMPAGGAGPASGHWLQLQTAIARDDAVAVKTAAAELDRLPLSSDPHQARRTARVEASSVWAALMDRDVDETQSMNVAGLLVESGDGWEASRILGQSALDHPSPDAARRLLEAARNVSNEVADAEAGDGLITLGLSEREAEVARLVSDGRTYKEVGAQLYISPKTVEHHVANVRQKLGASSRAEMIAIVRGATERER